MIPRISVNIGSGSYRNVYLFSENVCCKIAKEERRKSFGSFSIGFPSRSYTMLKFGITDFNVHEYRNYVRLSQRIPEHLRGSFAPIIGIGDMEGGSTLLQEVVRDYDGQISLSMLQQGPITNDEFWKRLFAIRDFLVRERIPFFNINPRKILVRRVDDRTMEPVFFDFKRIGVRTFPLQPHLLFWRYSGRKVMREFTELYEEFGRKS